jgi:DNA ligase-associated metallophosphoesterase
MTRVEVQGESLLLLPERALFWESTGTLIAADVHLGKAASFRAAAIPLPGGTTTETLARLTSAIERTGSERLLLLGDFFHAKSGRASRTLAAISSWRDRHKDTEIVLVRGNHDRAAGDPPVEWGFTCCDEPCFETPFVFRHHPVEETDGYVLAGHIHPAVSLSGPGRQREKLPCFFFGQRLALLPSFGDFTGGASIRLRRGDRAYVVAGDEIVAVRTD